MNVTENIKITFLPKNRPIKTIHNKSVSYFKMSISYEDNRYSAHAFCYISILVYSHLDNTPQS